MKLTRDDVTVTLTAEAEDISPEGAFATGDDAVDREIVEDIRARFNAGDEWAWFCAKVEVEWNGMTGTDYLGACSYDSEKAFREDDYFASMVETALAELNEKVDHMRAEIARLDAKEPKRIRGWKIQTTASGVEMTLVMPNEERLVLHTECGESLAFDLGRAARGLNGNYERLDTEENSG